MDGKPNPRPAAKVGHRKSRNGCTKCKTRRVKAVKCDEVRPVCSNCQRLNLPCAWPLPETLNGHNHNHNHTASRKSPSAARPSSSAAHPHAQHHLPKRVRHSPSAAAAATNQVSPGAFSAASTDVGDASSSAGANNNNSNNNNNNNSHHPSPPGESSERFSEMLKLWSGNTDPGSLGAPATSVSSILNPVVEPDLEDDCLLPESKQRRMLEHRLIQNYIYNLGIPFPVSPSHDWTNLWTKIIPPMTLQYDNILYAVMAHSATHLLRKEPGNRDLFHARQAYLVAAMRVQRRMVESLTMDIADAVCLASLIMLVQAFAMLDERIIDTYTPPMDWMRLGKGAGTVVWTSVEAIVNEGKESESVMLTIANSEPRMGFDESYFDASNRDQVQLRGLLDQDLPSGDDWSDASTREAYEKTLSYVGSMQLAIRDNEPTHVLCRRIQGFTMVIPPLFMDFVAMRRPRALVILAHFFAAAHQMSRNGVWWLGGEDGKETISQREVRGIRTIMPAEWMRHMAWPCEVTGDRPPPPPPPPHQPAWKVS